MELFYVIFAGFFVFVIVIIFRAFYNSIAEKRYNDSQPIFSKDARISAKRTELSGGGNHSVNTVYFATFEFAEDKKRLELEIDSDEYGLLAEGDLGTLTFQGRRYLRFERK